MVVEAIALMILGSLKFAIVLYFYNEHRVHKKSTKKKIQMKHRIHEIRRV